MNNKLTPEQALQNLYTADRVAKLSADEHAVILESAKIIQELITPKKEENKGK